MGNLKKLFQKAISKPNNLSFEDACSLAECIGFEFKRQKGDHKIFKNPKLKNEIINLQNVSGKAKPYQVKQLLKIIEKYNLT